MTAAAAPNSCNEGAGLDLAKAFAAGGTHSLTESLELEFCSLTLEAGTTLRLELAGKSLSVHGRDGGLGLAYGAAGGPGRAALTNRGTLIISGGALTLRGGSGTMGTEGRVDGMDGASSAGGNGGNGGAGGNGIINEGLLVLSGVNLAVAAGRGGSGAMGAWGAHIGDGNYDKSGDGGAGGNGGVGITNVGTLRLVGSLDVSGGNGGTGGNSRIAGNDPGVRGAGGHAGTGGRSVDNVGYIAIANYTAGSVSARGGDAGSPGVGSSDGESAANGASWPGGDPGIVTWDANWPDKRCSDGTDTWTVFPVDDASAGTALPTGWPACTGYSIVGAFHDSADGGELSIDHPTEYGHTYFAKWTMTAPPPPGDSGGGTVPATTSTSTTTSSPGATSPKPSTSRVSPAPSSTASIPTNNVKDPTTFTSSQAPSAPPLPTESSVNDTSASQFDVDTHTPTQGGDLTLVAKGFKPGTVVDFWMHSTPVYLGSAIADEHGIAVLPVKLDKTLVGQHHVQSAGIGLLGEPRNLAQPITITAPPALASTGFPTWQLTSLALLLIATGAWLLTAQRRSRHPIKGGNHL